MKGSRIYITSILVKGGIFMKVQSFRLVENIGGEQLL